MLNLAIAIVTGLILLIGVFSRLSAKYVSVPLIVFGVGVFLGPVVGDLIKAQYWTDEPLILEMVARFTLAVGLMGIALYLPKFDIRRRAKAVGTLIGIVMPLMWVVTALLVYLIFRFEFVLCLLIGAILTPTDPILARSIAQGKLAEENIPARMRYVLLEESALNDGLAYPFVLVVLSVLAHPIGVGLLDWFLYSLLLGVGGAVVLGIAVGYGAGILLKWSIRSKWIDSSSFFAYTIALSLFVVTVGEIAHTDSVLAVFFAGLALVATEEHEEQFRQEHIQSAIDHFFILPVFFTIGLTIPWQAWVDYGWSALLLVLAVFTLRRLPAVMLTWPLMKRQIHCTTEAAAVGWFGPIGVSGLYYAGYVMRRTPYGDIWPVASLIISASIVIFGLTTAPIVRRLGKFENGEAGG